MNISTKKEVAHNCIRLRNSISKTIIGVGQPELAMGDSNRIIHDVSYYGYAEGIKFLSDVVGLDVNVRNSYGNTPLHFAVRHNDLDCVKTLVEAGADINAINDHGVSVTDEAFRYKSKSVYDYLMERVNNSK